MNLRAALRWRALLAVLAGACLLGLAVLSVATPPPVFAARDANDKGCERGAKVPRAGKWNVRNYSYLINLQSIRTFASSTSKRNRQRRQARDRIIGAHNAWERTKTDCRGFRDQRNFGMAYAGDSSRAYGQSRDDDGNGQLDPPEDADNDGALDPGEDRNGNGRLDPAERDGYDELNLIDFARSLSVEALDNPGRRQVDGRPNRLGCSDLAVACAIVRMTAVDHDGDASTQRRDRIVEADIRVEKGPDENGTRSPLWYGASDLVRHSRCVPPDPGFEVRGDEAFSCADLLPVVTHEVGHTLGLNHSCDADRQGRCSAANKAQTMNGIVSSYRGPNFGPRPARQRTLGRAEVLSFRALYPRLP